MEPVYKWILVSARCTQMYLNKQLEPYRINASQYMFVVHICRRPGITQDALPDLIHINKSNVTRALNQLEQTGFIRREANPKDKRTPCVYPTKKAKEIYPAILEIIAAWDAILTGRLSLEEKNQLRELLFKAAGTAIDMVSTETR